MNEKLTDLIKKYLPNFFDPLIKDHENTFNTFSHKEKEAYIEEELHRHYPNQVDKRNKFRHKWNAILVENHKPTKKRQRK